MLNMRKKAIVTALSLATFAGASQAALQTGRPGPLHGSHGLLPSLLHGHGQRDLDLCLSKAVSPDPAAGGGFLCTLLPNPGVFDPALPIVFPTNFPDEAFYFTADANVVGSGIDLIYVAALEAAFARGCRHRATRSPSPASACVPTWTSTSPSPVPTRLLTPTAWKSSPP